MYEAELPVVFNRQFHSVKVTLQHLEQMFDECAEAGLLRPGMTANRTAMALAMWFEGIALFWMRNVDLPFFSLKAEVDRLVDIILRGIFREDTI